MTTLFKRTVIATALLLASARATRASISLAFSPISQTVPLSGTASVDLIVSGLGGGASPGTSPALGAFQFNVLYDASIVQATGVIFGLNLGDASASEALTFGDTSTPGSVAVNEISLLPPASLLVTQPSSFVLATLTFQAIGQGVTPLTFDSALFADESAAVLPFGASPGSIGVTPEPRYALFLALPLTLVLLMRRHRATKS